VIITFAKRRTVARSGIRQYVHANAENTHEMAPRTHRISSVLWALAKVCTPWVLASFWFLI